MPYVEVKVWEGFGEEKSKKVIKGITRAFVELGIPDHAVSIVIHEVPKSHYGVGGEPASVKFKDIPP